MSKRAKRRQLTAEEKNSEKYDIPGFRRRRAIAVTNYLQEYYDPSAPILLSPDMQTWTLDVLHAYLRQNPPQPIAPRGIAQFVDQELMVDPRKIEGGVAMNVGAARKKVARLTNKPLAAVKAAHLKHSRWRGVRGRPKKRSLPP